MVAISEVIARSGTLRKLDVSENHICGLDPNEEGDYSIVGVTALAEALKATRCLTELVMTGNLLQPEGFRALAPGVAACRTLNTLDVSDNEMAPDLDANHTFLSAKAAKAASPMRKGANAAQQKTISVGMEVDVRYWMDKESKRKESGRWYPAVINLARADGTYDVTYKEGGEKESRVRAEHLMVRWRKGDRAMYFETGKEYSPAIHTLKEAVEALILEERDRDGDVQIKVIGGVLAMADALARNTSLTDVSYAHRRRPCARPRLAPARGAFLCSEALAALTLADTRLLGLARAQGGRQQSRRRPRKGCVRRGADPY